jgi:glyoxylase-like metal-dependent hydrolase (beta-lactamase superfamily II)
MIFRQLFDPETSTYTYLLADEATREALLIDPVREQVARDAALVRELGLTLRFTLETHVHADHITGASLLRQQLGSRAAVAAAAGVACADISLADGATVRVGALELRALATPGHTNGCTSYYCAAAGMAFTGDALLIRGCGRTDFQQGDSRRLFRAVRERLFTLPDETLLYPGHDYRGRTVTTVAEEKRWNPRLGLAKSEEDFVAIMAALKLDYPKRMDESVPANLLCGTGPVPPAHEPAVANLVAAQSGRQDTGIDLGAGI